MTLINFIHLSRIIILGFCVFLLPGSAILGTLIPKWRKLPLEVFASLAMGLSISFYPILFLFAHILHISLYFQVLWGIIIILGVWLVILLVKQRDLMKTFLELNRFSRQFRENWILYSLLLFVGISLTFVRFWAIRSLPLPMWGDSVHHTLIAQLLVENQGLFDSWQPYAEMESLTYHFGFHANVATYALLSGLETAKATLIVGQFMNIFAVFCLSPLAWKISNGNRWATIASWVLAGFVFFMPMYYTNWGRYTQLCGQVLLPIVVFLIWDLLDEENDDAGVNRNNRGWLIWLKQRPWAKILLVALTSSGLALIHYRVFLFMLGSIPLLVILNLSQKCWRKQLINLALGGIFGFLLYLPWFLSVYGGKLFEGLIRGITTSPAAMSDYTRGYNAIGSLSGYLPLPIWVIFVFSIAWALWRRDKSVFFVVGWWSTVVLMANPNWVGLPGAGLLSNFAVFLAMYIPASLVIGIAFTWLMNPLRVKKTLIADILGTILVIGIILVTAKSRLDDIQPEPHAMATNQDIRAMEWIRSNTPSDTRILVNSFFAYGGSTIVGSDGGWWIPYFTQRKISVPPMPYVSEKAPFPNYVQYVNSLRQLIEEKGYTHPDVVAELKARGYEYAYIGAKGGRVNYTGPVVMKPKLMIESGFYEAVYHKGDVWILRLK
ncbi:MAG: hypothetical protein ANABAC_1012 [Anaerolineae bacterium]|nr:MAG: hypothetical protein ANABAC_1012 [Anaerolineae bacterium]